MYFSRYISVTRDSRDFSMVNLKHSTCALAAEFPQQFCSLNVGTFRHLIAARVL